MANPFICIFNPITTLIDQIPAASSGPGVPGSPVVLNTQGLIDPSLFSGGTFAVAGETITGGRLINLYAIGSVLHMQNAYAAATGTAPSGSPYPVPAIGFVQSGVFVGNLGSVQFSGVFTYVDPNAEFSSGDISSVVYLTAATPPSTNLGGITKTKPSGLGQLQQAVGTVVGFTNPNFVLVAFSTSSSSGVTGSGTVGFVPIFSGTSALGDSSLEEEGYLQTAEGFLSTSLTVNPFGNVGATVTATPTGSGPTTYRYVITVLDTNNYSTAGSAPSSPITNATTLNGSHFNTITWSPNPVFAGAALYNIYRTVGGATQGIIGQWFIGDPPFVDNGLVGDGSTVPSQNFSGSIVAQNTLAIIGWTSAAFSPDVSNTICVGKTPGGGVIPQPGDFSGAIKLTTVKFADGTSQSTGAINTNGITFGTTTVPTTNLKIVSNLSNTTGLASGDVDIYTVPSGKKALVIEVSYTNPSTNVSNVTAFAEFKISGVYTKWDFISVAATPGRVGIVALLTPMLLNVGETFAINSDNAGLSVWPFVLEFDDTANINVTRFSALASGNNTVFTAPANGIQFIGNLESQSAGSPLKGTIYYFNNTGVSRTVGANIVPLSGSVSPANQILTGQSVSSPQVFPIPFYGGLKTGDFLNINTDSSATPQLAWVVYRSLP